MVTSQSTRLQWNQDCDCRTRSSKAVVHKPMGDAVVAHLVSYSVSTGAARVALSGLTLEGLEEDTSMFVYVFSSNQISQSFLRSHETLNTHYSHINSTTPQVSKSSTSSESNTSFPFGMRRFCDLSTLFSRPITYTHTLVRSVYRPQQEWPI